MNSTSEQLALASPHPAFDFLSEQRTAASFTAGEFMEALRTNHKDAPVYFRLLHPKGANGDPRWKTVEIECGVNWLSETTFRDDFMKVALGEHHRSNENGVYFVVNVGGRKQGESVADHDITHYVAAFVECDNISIAEQHAQLDTAPLKTSARIETAKSVHAYYFLAQGCSEAAWREIQQRLIAYFKGDARIKNPSRIMRLPGFDHTTLVGAEIVRVPVRCVQLAPEQSYSIDELLAAFPAAAMSKGKKPTAKSGRRLPDEIPEHGGANSEGRNPELFKEACKLFRMPYKPAVVRGMLGAINAEHCKPPMDENELDMIVENARKAVEKERAGDASETMAAGAVPAERRCTDVGNAHGFVARFGDDIRYCREKKAWYVWNGKRWKRDGADADDGGDDTVKRFAMDYAKTIFDEAKTAGEHMQKLSRHAVYSNSAKGIESFLNLARDVSGVPISIGKFDADPNLLNVLNGTIDLRTGELKEHSREDFNTKLAPVIYDPNAKAPRFEQFLNEVFGNNAELVGYMQRVVGYTLTGQTGEHVFFILYGDGRNGKGTLVRALLSMLGDFGATTSTSVLLMKKDNGGAATPEIAKLKSIRFAEASETDAGQRMAEALVKRITGGDTVECRFLNENPFTYTPEFKLWLSTNHKPQVAGTDLGMWSRIKLIPFLQKFEGDKKDISLDDKLKAELPGILAWAVRGAVEWYQHGLGTCKAVEAATAVYREESDSLSAFLKECCDKKEGEEIASSSLHYQLERWCNENGGDCPDKKELSAQLKLRGFKSKRKSGGMFWQGLTMKPFEDEGESTTPPIELGGKLLAFPPPFQPQCTEKVRITANSWS